MRAIMMGVDRAAAVVCALALAALAAALVLGDRARQRGAVLVLALAFALGAGCGDNVHACADGGAEADAAQGVDAQAEADAAPRPCDADCALDYCRTFQRRHLQIFERCGATSEEAWARYKSIPGAPGNPLMCEAARSVRDPAELEACLLWLAHEATGGDCAAIANADDYGTPAVCHQQFPGAP